MRRECRRQHGIVGNYRILPPPLNPRLTSPLNAGLFTKLPSKPIKVHWVRSNDIASPNCKLLTWRVDTGSESGPVSNQPGLSETGIEECEDERREAEIETVKMEKDGDNSEKEDGGFHEDDGSMSFYDVGMMMVEHVLDEDEEEEDGWCLV